LSAEAAAQLVDKLAAAELVDIVLIHHTQLLEQILIKLQLELVETHLEFHL
jgi:hypothetical protein